MSVLTVTTENYDAEVVASDKPVLLDFWAPWCGPCRMIAPFIEQIEQERPDIKVGRVNVDEEQELASRFEVMSIPMLVLLQKGEVLSRRVGAQPKAAILKMLED